MVAFGSFSPPGCEALGQRFKSPHAQIMESVRQGGPREVGNLRPPRLLVVSEASLASPTWTLHS